MYIINMEREREREREREGERGERKRDLKNNTYLPLFKPMFHF